MVIPIPDIHQQIYSQPHAHITTCTSHPVASLSLSLNLIVRIGTATHLGHLVNFDLVHLDNGRSLLPLTRLCCTTLSSWCTLLGSPTRDGNRLCPITRRNQAISCSRCCFGCFTKTLLEGIDEWEAKEF